MVDHSALVEQVRKIASRGRVDDADVQILFDAAEAIEQLMDQVEYLQDQVD
jgi:uncharacterized protein YgbK (DUF1537 family)